MTHARVQYFRECSRMPHSRARWLHHPTFLTPFSSFPHVSMRCVSWSVRLASVLLSKIGVVAVGVRRFPLGNYCCWCLCWFGACCCRRWVLDWWYTLALMMVSMSMADISNTALIVKINDRSCYCCWSLMLMVMMLFLTWPSIDILRWIIALRLRHLGWFGCCHYRCLTFPAWRYLGLLWPVLVVSNIVQYTSADAFN